MEKPAAFFVPAATPDNQESVYAELARLSRCAVPPVERRIYSITYTHDGEEWTATVGAVKRLGSPRLKPLWFR